MSDYRARLTILTRSHHQGTTTVAPQTNLMSRGTFTGHADLLEAFDRFENARAARHKAHAESRRLRDKATQGRAEYQKKMADAIATGGDVSKITDPHDKLIGQAEAQDAIANNASGQLLRLGNDLGELISHHAAELYGPSDDTMAAAAERVHADIASLTESWKVWNLAYQVRRILTDAHLYGGRVGNYDPNPGLPKVVAEALGALTDELGKGLTIATEVGSVLEWQEGERRADAHNATVNAR